MQRARDERRSGRLLDQVFPEPILGSDDCSDEAERVDASRSRAIEATGSTDNLVFYKEMSHMRDMLHKS